MAALGRSRTPPDSRYAKVRFRLARNRYCYPHCPVFVGRKEMSKDLFIATVGGHSPDHGIDSPMLSLEVSFRLLMAFLVVPTGLFYPVALE